LETEDRLKEGRILGEEGKVRRNGKKGRTEKEDKYPDGYKNKYM
jgi:hypothetical protein